MPKKGPSRSFTFANLEFPVDATDGQLWNWAQNQPDKIKAFRDIIARRDTVANQIGLQHPPGRSPSGFARNAAPVRLSEQEQRRIFESEQLQSFGPIGAPASSS